ncbi:hypothetical protein IMCC1933_16500 [Rhodobacteraceae bacterium IMCC1933]|nr:hypothetical protein [Rhodobacteraceae bacterium IMCC1923]MDP4068102.1 hypothetical protein [Rhodobacteraceae bacterium IMCC1933]MDP4070038.1 hypothetical protein [Rhodobacteraceae bacterium IMCC1909]
MTEQMTATRAEAQARLERFAPNMGRDYAQGRNFDRGAGAHRDVSMLSPYIRRRLLTEQEVIATAIKSQGAEASAKFIDEVIWRSYFKGWLEQRPEVWDSYAAGLRQDLAKMQGDAGLRHAIHSAETGQTGLSYFDSWALELIETGYLHNHARMWFASIWIFSLKLPWRVGADFFLRHLLDGDPASNTLSWRWVAGLHTRGKPYVAQEDNIARFTNERFVPRAQELTQNAAGLEALEPDGLPACKAPRSPLAPQSRLPTALLLTEEDCRIEDFPIEDLICTTAATLAASPLRSPREVARLVVQFEAGALADVAQRSGVAVSSMALGAPSDLAQWALQSGAEQIVTPYVPVGPLREWLLRAKPELDAAGISLAEWRRDWDAMIWPYATAGFFKVKKQIPKFLREIAL